jgi:iron complex transport system substrate-binding protein
VRTVHVVIIAAIMSIIVISSAMVYAVFSPGKSPQSKNSITVIDALDRSVKIDLPVKKVIITGRSAFPIVTVAYMFPEAENLVYDVDPSMANVELFKMIDPNIESKTNSQLGTSSPNIEDVAREKPDVVILKTSMKSGFGDSLELLGIKVVYVDFENLDSYLRDLVTLGKILGDEQRGEDIANYYREMYENTLARTSAGENRPEVLFLYYSTKGGTISFSAPGKGFLQTSMIEAAGGRSLSEEFAGTGWNQVSFEQIASWNPDIIFLSTYSNSPSPFTLKENLLNDPIWKNITAVASGRIYAIPDDCGNMSALGSWDTPGSRWIIGLQWMATKIRPDLFQGIDLKNNVKEFYSSVYGLSDENVNQLVNLISGDFL